MSAPDRSNTAVVAELVDAPPALPFQLYETRPTAITQHVIWDHELDKIVNISRPITLGASTTLLGAFLGLLPTVAEAIADVVSKTPLGLGDLLLSLVAALCLAGGGVSGFFAYRGQLDAFAIRNEVRSRNLRAVNPGQRGGA